MKKLKNEYTAFNEIIGIYNEEVMQPFKKNLKEHHITEKSIDEKYTAPQKDEWMAFNEESSIPAFDYDNINPNTAQGNDNPIGDDKKINSDRRKGKSVSKEETAGNETDIDQGGANDTEANIESGGPNQKSDKADITEEDAVGIPNGQA